GVTYRDWSLHPIRERDGRVGGVVLSLVDVTAKRRAQEELRQNEELLRQVLDLLPVGVWISDREGRITLGNPAGQRIWAGLKQFGKISACSVVANIAGTAAYDAMIEKKTSGFNAITTKTENPNQMFVRGKTYRLTVTQDTLGKTGYTTKFEEVSTPIQQAQMEKDIAEKKGKMLTFKETTEEKRPPEMRPLEVWLLKTTLTTERELLDKYNYPAAGKDADKLAVAKSHIKILQNREIQKLIYYYTDPVLIDGKDNKKAILNAEEPLAIAILLQGWKDFEKQKDSEFANYTGWLRDKLVIAATERVKYPGEDAFKTPANGRALAVKIFPELKGNIEAQDNFLKLYNSWQQVWTNSTSARATNTGGSTIK
ncbi:MAG: PAS domain-containing protein, partial [Candidatus Diapherotrites archaeon]|nr:PAS domain-containing protein [Candidatus Diapherotrites archaeon]